MDSITILIWTIFTKNRAIKMSKHEFWNLFDRWKEGDHKIANLPHTCSVQFSLIIYKELKLYWDVARIDWIYTYK